MRSLTLCLGTVFLLSLAACSSGGSGNQAEAKRSDGGGADRLAVEVSRPDLSAANDATTDARASLDGTASGTGDVAPRLDSGQPSVDAWAQPSGEAGGNSDGLASSLDTARPGDAGNGSDAPRSDTRPGDASAGADLGASSEAGSSRDTGASNDVFSGASDTTLITNPVDAPSDSPPPTPDSLSNPLDVVPIERDADPAANDAGEVPSVIGLWEGSYLVDSSSDPPVPIQVIIDPGNHVYLNAMDFEGVGQGTISATGEVLVVVSGAALGTVTYEGEIVGASGSGTWSNAGNGHTGTWTVTKRAGVAVTADMRGMCDQWVPCSSDPNTPSDPSSMVYCMYMAVVPPPLGVLFNDRMHACLPVADCAALWDCFAQGSLSVVYVSTTGNDANDGSTPAKAKRTINAGIGVTAANGTVRIAAGTYQENLLVSRPVTLQGGYDNAFTRIDIVASPVIIDGRSLDGVVTSFFMRSSANIALKGLRIINGLADGLFGHSGGGFRTGGWYPPAATIEDCTFSGNHAVKSGGALMLNDTSLTLTRCTFENNTSDGNSGGAISVYRSTVVATSTIIRNNQGPRHGGGISLDEGTATLEACTITGNTAGTGGGGIMIWTSPATATTIKDSTITGNTPNGISGNYTNLGGNTIQ